MTKASNRNFDLEDRTAKFGEKIIQFAKKIPSTIENNSLRDQLVRSGTSIGANYCEADEAESKRDFVHKIGICKKESRETKYWLRPIAVAGPNFREDARTLWKEAHELNLIFAAIIRKSKAKPNIGHSYI
ncbi:MAG: four helix bundle protein [Candidatus Sungbacteria bacterium]|uniref:Four helix bundle protein n=1 Tax=Candidatus Sungiibacteriota bacterium TaxID=2750080 RepID=A0A932YWN1_9BACT|nr:four helix bundle protein [Candidatus Sungbacteria bacterium]